MEGDQDGAPQEQDRQGGPQEARERAVTGRRFPRGPCLAIGSVVPFPNP
jgi:hypothetical protein